MDSKAHPLEGKRGLGLVVAFVVLFAVISFLFRGNYLPGHTLFSNDGPLGTLMSEAHRLPEGFSGAWEDLNTVGYRGGGALPSVTYGLLLLLGPVGYSKFYAPVALLILGLGAWTFFRQLRLAPLACVLGALAATLNSGFFSAACWGVASHPITIGLSYFALAALVDTSTRRRWIRVALAGVAVGLAVADGADIGAIFSLYVAAFVLYQAWTQEGNRGMNLGTGVVRVGIVAVFAAFLAAQSMSVLVSTQVKGVAGTGQDTRSKEERWDWATQWSLPKREALGLFVPGLFGYRMDTPNGGNYWGAAGRDPGWDRWFAAGKQGQPPAGFMRFTGGGNYAGVLVVLVAVWAALQSLRKKDSGFSLPNRRWLWFWLAVAVISLLLAFGRFAPFYRLLYALPYFSTVRNPAKFTHVVNWAIVVLFAYGVHGLWRLYMQPAEAGARPGLRAWWERVRGFDRTWTAGCAGAIAVSLLAWLVYAAGRDGLEKYLQEVQFDANSATAIARFSVAQVGWFILLLAAAVILVTFVLSGTFSGPRAKWGGLVLGLFLVLDLGRANQPWIINWDYEQKYATNPIIEQLRKQPWEHRVAILPEWINRATRAPQDLALVDQLYRIEWAQHLFLYYNIQSLDIVQMPRMPEDLMAFETALQPRSMADLPRVVARRWELTNTRYLIGGAAFLDFLNQQLDPVQKRFQIAQRFQIVPKQGIASPTRLEDLTAVTATNGTFALFEFTGALPRAKLYSQWVVKTNDQAALTELTSNSFVPANSVVVDEPLVLAPGAPGTNQPSGKVEFAAYAPKNIKLKTDAASQTVLLLSDRYDPNWKVSIDGRPAPLLRCNYLMRGVSVPPGKHEVQFQFRPENNWFYVSLAAVAVGLVLCGLLLVVRDPVDGQPKEQPKEPEPKSAAPAGTATGSSPAAKAK